MKTITIIENDRVGLLADISHILGDAKINIDSIDVDVVGGKAIITLGLSDATKGKKLLLSAGYKVEETNALTIALTDRPGELDKVTTLLAKEGINIEKVLMLSKDGKRAILSIKVDDPKKAARLLKGYLLTKEK